MPQVDLETVDCGGGGEQKFACETQIDGDSSPEQPPTPPENPPDFPAESFYLSKEDEFDWFDRNAFYERKESTKGNSANSNNNNNSNSTTTSTSQRFSLTLKSKTSIIGLPKAPQNSTYTTCKFRHNGKPSNARFFPKRSRSSGNQETAEPSSPKVSCMGRVRSRRQRLRQLSKKRSTTVRSDKGAGFWGSLKAVLFLRCRETQAVNIIEGSTESPHTPSQKSEKRKSPTTETPGLNELKRFASGRRFDSLDGGAGGNVDLEIDEFDSANRGRRGTRN